MSVIILRRQTSSLVLTSLIFFGILAIIAIRVSAKNLFGFSYEWAPTGLFSIEQTMGHDLQKKFGLES